MKKIFDKAFLLYVLTGVLNYGLCNSIMFLLYNLGLCNMSISSLVNYTLGGFVWYFACWKLVFPGLKQTPALVSRFIAEILICYLLSYYVIAPLTLELALTFGLVSSHHHVMSAQAAGNYTMAIGSVTYSILNYFGQRFFVFVHRDSRHNRLHFSR